MIAPPIHLLLERAEKKWTERQDEAHHLAVLRELHAGLHAALSGTLARGDRIEAAWIKATMDRCEELRDRELSAGDLKSLLSGTITPPLRARPELPEIVPLEPLSPVALARPDRIWEAAIIREGLAQGLRLTQIEHAVPASRLQAISGELSEMNWPGAIFLFAESHGVRSPEGGGEPLWQAGWLFMHEPGSMPQLPPEQS